MASITFHVPDQEPLQIELDGTEQVTIGRGPDNDVVLDHVSLSGSHAVIQNLGGSFQVKDLESTNGTFLNGEAVTEGPLAHGSRLMFGSVEAVFADEASAGAGAEEPDVAGAGAAEAAEAGAAEGGGAGGYGSHAAELAEVSNRPSGFVNLSPIEKVEKKNPLGQVAMLIGVVAILGAAGLVALSFTMSAA